ncbi:MAG: ABC transporter ATP-binding protein, partial [Cyclobacteriaceae bacterium]|nr:ABC transporter ATP-binding protein [Cyclobacteriaceae bacterium]
AFEAAMVSQFKDNPYERIFYKHDKTMAVADYKRIYYIPELETRLEYCFNNIDSQDPEIIKQKKDNFELLRFEFSKEIASIGTDKFSRTNEFTLETFDASLFKESKEFLETLKRFYGNRHKKADAQKDQIMVKLTDTSEKKEWFLGFKERYHNEAIAELVKNQSEQHRIVESGNHLFQKIYPIYMDPQPRHVMDFRTEFYVPQKHFMGYQIDTLYFNLFMIWVMSLILIITLYFDLLRVIIEFFEKLFTKAHY